MRGFSHNPTSANGGRAKTESDMDRMPSYPFQYLFCLTNTNMDTYIIQMQEFISIFILNRYGRKLDTKIMNIDIDISRIIKFYDHQKYP